MDKFKIICVSMLFFFGFISHSYGWNQTAHVLVAQIAYDQLNEQQQKKVDALAFKIFTTLPSDEQKKYNNKYKAAATFAKVSTLPDEWQGLKLNDIFLKFHAVIPDELTELKNETTGSWHYIDIPYPQSKTCVLPEKNNVILSINRLKSVLETEKSDVAKAIELVFLTHFIGDIHQFLHTLTNVSNSCDGDYGGNKHCLKRSTNGKCVENLHSLWDSGVGYFKSNTDIHALAVTLEQSYPQSQFMDQLNILNPESWSNENYSNADFVYHIPTDKEPDAGYVRKGQEMAKKQIALAGYRLARELKEML